MLWINYSCDTLWYFLILCVIKVLSSQWIVCHCFPTGWISVLCSSSREYAIVVVSSGVPFPCMSSDVYHIYACWWRVPDHTPCCCWRPVWSACWPWRQLVTSRITSRPMVLRETGSLTSGSSLLRCPYEWRLWGTDCGRWPLMDWPNHIPVSVSSGTARTNTS